MIVDFDFLFTTNDDGSFTTRVPIDIPGIVRIASGAELKGDEVNGVDPVKELKGKKLEVEKQEMDGHEYYVIKAEVVD